MMEIDKQGFVYVKKTISEIQPGARDWEFGLLKFSPDGQVLDTIRLPRENPATGGFVLMTPEGPLHSFVVSTRVAWSPEGYIVYGRNDEYAITLVSPDGRTIGTLQRRTEAASLSDQERKQWQEWAEFMNKSSLPGRSRTDTEIPETKPYFRDIHVGDAGRIWVHRYSTAEQRDFEPRKQGDSRPLLTWREPPTFDVFDVDEGFVGTVVLPRDTRLCAVRDDRLWGVQATDQGERLVGFRLEQVSN
jgi:hypothetical protein